MFTESYPTLPDWVTPRSTPWARGAGPIVPAPIPAYPGDQHPEASSFAPTGESSPMTTSRGPTARAKRFLYEAPEDRTFERTMRTFLRGEHDPGRKKVGPEGHGT